MNDQGNAIIEKRIIERAEYTLDKMLDVDRQDEEIDTVVLQFIAELELMIRFVHAGALNLVGYALCENAIDACDEWLRLHGQSESRDA